MSTTQPSVGTQLHRVGGPERGHVIHEPYLVG
jgi:hypothetical protein